MNHVFISYRHESLEHARAVRRLGDLLRQAGIPVELDQFYLEAHRGGPDEGWPKWCEDRATKSACVLIIGSVGWFTAYEKTGTPGIGLGAASEADLFRQAFWDKQGNNARIRVAFLHDVAADTIPVRLRTWHPFRPLASNIELDELIAWVAERLGLNNVKPAAPDWPEKPPSLRWPIADHTDTRAAFEKLLSRTTSWRFLLLRGPTEVGKSHITRQMLGNVLRMPDFACGRFDFKGTTDMDAELRVFVDQLQVPAPSSGQRLIQCLVHIFEQLRQRGRPTLLIFDTYEAVGEARDWVERQLLEIGLIRNKWLRVVIAGQRVPEPTGATWEPESFPIITLKTPAPTDWLDYTKEYRPELTLAQVETACLLARNKAPQLASMLGPES